MFLKIILIVAGSIFFPAVGYYLDYRDRKKRKGKKKHKSISS
ncbi:hypothetical protein [Microscilla marina]|uniref:Uncharacterized protein n=1 Tax=Microscilla marina ATCC 23134 TaxID=313606 RepID=A1ZLS1_MICM2|nr:hypothetical protein [Microscilla marina]EAY28825.1 hypothetical protein M23134_07923 [Microscilla marina ATCC 23134]